MYQTSVNFFGNLLLHVTLTIDSRIVPVWFMVGHKTATFFGLLLHPFWGFTCKLTFNPRSSISPSLLLSREKFDFILLEQECGVTPSERREKTKTLNSGTVTHAQHVRSRRRIVITTVITTIIVEVLSLTTSNNDATNFVFLFVFLCGLHRQGDNTL
jgi:hypothetical protein